MKPKILSWNVRGCCGLEKRMLIKSSINKWHPDVVCLQETKLTIVDDSVVRSLWGGGWTKWVALNSVGASGGILVMWDDRKLSLLDSEVGSHSLSCLFKHLEEDISWSFTGVYGPVDNNLKAEFLEEIGASVFRWNVPWCLGGDFNMVRSTEEKWKCKRRTKHMKLFSDFIDDLSCVDLPLGGCKYTWSNTNSKSKLDRFLVLTDWEDLFPEVYQKTLSRLISDHFPIMLDGGGLKGGPKPFRFENMWLQADGFKEKIAEWWTSYQFNGSASFILMQKLSCLKADLKRWNKEVFGRIDIQKLQLEKDIQRLDLTDDNGKITDLERSIRESKVA